MRRLIPALIALSLASCGVVSELLGTGPQDECNLRLSAEPIAGFPGLYHISVSGADDYTISVNAVAATVEHGNVRAQSGDIVMAAGDCGNSNQVVLP